MAINAGIPIVISFPDQHLKLAILTEAWVMKPAIWR
jgi:hypothetical protein